MQDHGPRLSKYLRVIYRHINVKAAEIRAPDPFRHASLAREEISGRVEPRIVTIPRGLNHQRIAFPVADRVAIPRRQHVVRKFTPAEKDLPVAGIELMKDNDLAGCLEFFSVSGKAHARGKLGEHAVHVGIEVRDIFGAALDQICCPGLVGKAVLEADREVQQLRPQGKFGALHTSLFGVAGQNIARDPHAREVGFTGSSSWRGRGEVQLMISRARNTRPR
jgi:hypothetical protein